MRGRGQVKQPVGRCRRVCRRNISAVQQRVGTIVAVAAEIAAQQRIHIRLQIVEEFSAAQVFAGSRKIRPETFRHPGAVDLLLEREENLFPLSDGLCTRALFVIGQRPGGRAHRLYRAPIPACVDSRQWRERCLRCRSNSPPQSGIRRRLPGLCSSIAGRKSSGLPCLVTPSVFAVARAVVEPDIPGELLTLGQPASPDARRWCHLPERRGTRRSLPAFFPQNKVRPGRCTHFDQTGVTDAAARRNQRMRQCRVSVGYDIVGSVLSGDGPDGSPLHQLIRLASQ